MVVNKIINHVLKGINYNYRILNKKMKAVNQIDLVTGEIINTFQSMQEARRFLKKKHAHNIKSVCDGNKTEAYGYGWKYTNEE